MCLFIGICFILLHLYVAIAFHKFQLPHQSELQLRCFVDRRVCDWEYVSGDIYENIYANILDVSQGIGNAKKAYVYCCLISVN